MSRAAQLADEHTGEENRNKHNSLMRRGAETPTGSQTEARCIPVFPSVLEPARKPRTKALKEKTTNFVIPAKAGIYPGYIKMDTCFRRYDKQEMEGCPIGSSCSLNNVLD